LFRIVIKNATTPLRNTIHAITPINPKKSVSSVAIAMNAETSHTVAGSGRVIHASGMFDMAIEQHIKPTVVHTDEVDLRFLCGTLFYGLASM
jgi:hypothetical protein